MKYSLGTSLHDGDVEEFLRMKTPKWRREGVLEEQTFLMEDMSSYFRKWREWRNTYLSNKSFTSIKGVEKDSQSTNQSYQSTTQQSTKCQSISTNPSFSTSFQQFQHSNF